MDETCFSLVACFADVSDPRVDRTKLHKLVDILVIAVCAVVAGSDTFESMELFGNAHEEWFKTFLNLPNGIPSQDTFERVFSRINPVEFRKCFSDWTRSLAGIFKNEIIAIDGQTLRGAKRAGQSSSPVHMVSAWAVGLRLVLGQTKVDEKSNEITAIPEVLKLLDLKGSIVTLDAMGCQQKIACQIVEKGGDYLFGLKGNQGATLEALTQIRERLILSRLLRWLSHLSANGQRWSGVKVDCQRKRHRDRVQGPLLTKSGRNCR